MPEWDGHDRRAQDTSAIVTYRLDLVEKKLDKLDGSVGEIIKDTITMKAELASIAKSEGKTSGAVYGVGSSIIMAVLTALVGMVLR